MADARALRIFGLIVESAASFSTDSNRTIISSSSRLGKQTDLHRSRNQVSRSGEVWPLPTYSSASTPSGILFLHRAFIVILRAPHSTPPDDAAIHQLRCLLCTASEWPQCKHLSSSSALEYRPLSSTCSLCWDTHDGSPSRSICRRDEWQQ